MRKAGAAKVEVPSVSLKSLVPIVSKDKQEKQQLEEDLTKMGYNGVLLQPWSLKNKAMAQEFLQARSNKWKGTIRLDPERWTTDLWAEIYNFQKEGRSLAGRIDKHIDGKFKTSINPKDGYAMSDCVDPRERRVLEFVIPILYPKKQNWVTKTIGNTIFGAQSGVWKVSWRQVIKEIVG